MYSRMMARLSPWNSVLVVMDCCTSLAPLTSLSGLLDPFTTEELYFHVYVRYESRLNRCPYPPFPFPTYYPDTATGSKYSNRTYVGPLTQPLLKHTPQRLTPLHTLSPTHPLLRASM
jgi:hypothetical protein